MIFMIYSCTAGVQVTTALESSPPFSCPWLAGWPSTLAALPSTSLTMLPPRRSDAEAQTDPRTEIGL